MNILMINGTMRKSSTYTIGKKVIGKIAVEDDTVRELFLPKDMPEFCRGCGVCIKEDEQKCPDHIIYMRHITKMIDEADLLVFTTPVFVYHTTGQMKALLDHYGYRWMVHRPAKEMFKKQAICIATGAGAGMKKAMRDITDSLRYWGIARIYTYGTAVAATSWNEVNEETKMKIEEAINTLAPKIERDTEQITPSLKIKILFYIMRAMQKKAGAGQKDRDYWEAQGWLGRQRPWK